MENMNKFLRFEIDKLTILLNIRFLIAKKRKKKSPGKKGTPRPKFEIHATKKLNHHSKAEKISNKQINWNFCKIMFTRAKIKILT